jgi:hypothetical protein
VCGRDQPAHTETECQGGGHRQIPERRSNRRVKGGGGRAGRGGTAVRPALPVAPREAKTDFRAPGCPISAHGRTAGGFRHLAFGQGRHYCLGAPLARLHLQAAWLALTEAEIPARIERAAVERIPTSSCACPLLPTWALSSNDLD